MNYEINISNFTGPFDLLLYLIKKADIDIFDINISDIINQYLSYIKGMQKLDLDVDSEYLVMASELIRIKSRELLPRKEDEEEEDDLKEQLVNRLALYKKFKDVSLYLSELESKRCNYFCKEPSLIEEYRQTGINIINDIKLSDLLDIYKKFCQKKEYEKPLSTTVTSKGYSVSKRNNEILNYMNYHKKFSLNDLFDIKSKPYVVVTFLSVLDLAGKGHLKISQNNYLDNISISVKGD